MGNRHTELKETKDTAFPPVCDADEVVATEKVQHLQHKPTFEVVGHALKADAPDLFKPCATQRLYLHEHPDFDDISEVKTHLFTILHGVAQRYALLCHRLLPNQSLCIPVCATVCNCKAAQVLWLDADTLWFDSMMNMKDVFKEFAEKEALLGLVAESTHLMASTNWYKLRKGRTAIYCIAACNPKGRPSMTPSVARLRRQNCQDGNALGR